MMSKSEVQDLIRAVNNLTEAVHRIERVQDDLRDDVVRIENMLTAQAPQRAHKPVVTANADGGTDEAAQPQSVDEVCDWINRWTPQMEAYTLTDVKKELRQMGCTLYAVTGRAHTLIRRALMQCGWIPPTMPTKFNKVNGRWWYPPQMGK